jgi:hypothetical protein
MSETESKFNIFSVPIQHNAGGTEESFSFSTVLVGHEPPPGSYFVSGPHSHEDAWGEILARGKEKVASGRKT